MPSLPSRAAWPLVLMAAAVPFASAPLAASAAPTPARPATGSPAAGAPGAGAPATGGPVRDEPARPHDAAGARHPAGRLTLSTTDEAGTRRALAATHARLTCHPTGGTHPRAGAACAALDRARGDFTRLPHEPAMCTQEYAPVTAEAHGTWRGRPIHREVTYDNRCQLSAHTGAVFDF